MLFLLISGLLPRVAYAETHRPFLFSNQSPFSWIQGQAFTPDARVLETNQFQVDIDIAWASHSFKQNSRSELLIIDGETVQLNLLFKRGVGRIGSGGDVEIGLLLPFIHFGGGLLDSEITHFHSTFGLPHGERLKTSNNQINFQYGKGQSNQNLGLDEGYVALIDVSPGGSHLSDVRVFLSQQHKTQAENGYNLAWQNELKIPTGKAEDWSGNDALALSSSIAYDSNFYPNKYMNWLAFGHIGARYSELGSVLADQQEQFGVFAGFGLTASLQSLQLQVQIDAHSATYKSTLNAFGPSLQVTFGGNYLTRSGLFSFSLGEDLFPETAPDVVLKLAWSQVW